MTSWLSSEGYNQGHKAALRKKRMNYVLAILPILIVLCLMIFLRWGGQRAGPIGWACCALVASLAFGLNWKVFWVSQVKGLLLSLNVLVVLWAALYLYYLVNQIGGVEAIALRLEELIADKGLLFLVLAWIFSAMIEGVAGFGMPMAIVAPMLVALGVPPLVAVAAPAVGHTWAVTFGNMGLVIQSLVAVTKIEASALAPVGALLLGVACLICGLAVAVLLKQVRRWPTVILLAVCMSFVQYFMATIGLPNLGSFSAALVGIMICILLSRRRKENVPIKPTTTELTAALLFYGLAIAVIVLVAILTPVNKVLSQIVVSYTFPMVITSSGVTTPAGPGQVFHPLLHPGVLIFLTTLICYPVLRRKNYIPPGVWRQAAAATVRSAGMASIGIVSMVGLSTLMEHCGMTTLLAQGLGQTMGAAFPLFSPLVGMLGAFATGSNVNSNVLFAALQQKIAIFLKINQVVLVSGQTAGGSIGSMISPAKLVVGCSTSKMKGREGEVLRYTLPAGIIIGLLVGAVTWMIAYF
jgi:lactate permease